MPVLTIAVKLSLIAPGFDLTETCQKEILFSLVQTPGMAELQPPVTIGRQEADNRRFSQSVFPEAS
jgi:hypothetical protein